jgi:hypothetical protein
VGAPTEESSDSVERAPASPEQPPAEPRQGDPAPIDPEDLPDIDSLDANSDFTTFMRPGVPEHLRTLALRKLWRSDPIFSKLDGLVEYGEDYSIPSWPKGTIKTAYQIGRGFVNELEQLGEGEAQSQTPEGPVAGPVPETGPADASADPKPVADSPAGTRRPVPESTASDTAQAPSQPAAAGPTAERRPRALPRRG